MYSIFKADLIMAYETFSEMNYQQYEKCAYGFTISLFFYLFIFLF